MAITCFSMLTAAQIKIKYITRRYVAPNLMEEGSKSLKITCAITSRKVHHRAGSEFSRKALCFEPPTPLKSV